MRSKTNLILASIMVVGIIGFIYTSIAWRNSSPEAKIGKCFLHFAEEDGSIDAERMQNCMAYNGVYKVFFTDGSWNRWNR